MIVTWVDQPIETLKNDMGTVINLGTGFPRCTWNAPAFPGFVIDGNGWEPLSGCVVRYSAKVSCLYSSNTDDNFDVAEEMARQVFSALALAGFGFDKVGPVGVFDVFGQKFAGAQIVCYTQLTLLEGA